MALTRDGVSSPVFSAAVTNTATFGSERARTFGSVSAETSRLRMALPWITAYALVSYLTGAFFMADTVNYVTDVYNHYRGFNNSLWEFGHLLWRPLGWVLLRTLGPLIKLFAGPDPQIQVTYIFLALNWLAGLACVLLLRACLHRFWLFFVPMRFSITSTQVRRTSPDWHSYFSVSICLQRPLKQALPHGGLSGPPVLWRWPFASGSRTSSLCRGL